MMKCDYGEKDSQNVLIQIAGEHDLSQLPDTAAQIRELAGGDFCLTVFKVADWNRELSPWKAPAVFGDEDFGEGARETLDRLLKMPTDIGKRYYIGGYSLAGLFALWAAYQTDVFAGAAAVSPSIWFPGFADYMKEREILTGKVYLSLGDREEKTGNTVLRTVGGCIREGYEILKGKGADCVLEWNKGNHFKEPGKRVGKGFAWLLGGKR